MKERKNKNGYSKEGLLSVRHYCEDVTQQTKVICCAIGGNYICRRYCYCTFKTHTKSSAQILNKHALILVVGCSIKYNN